MKNQLKLFFALTIGVFSLTNCGSEETPPLIGEAVFSTTPNASCTAADRKNVVYKSNAAFVVKWEECGRSTWGNGTETTACLVKAFPALSKSCSSCFGEHVACSSSNCKWTCLFQSSDSCEQCSKQHCEAALSTCTGITPPNLPSKY